MTCSSPRERAPRRADPRAGSFEDELSRSLGAGDAAALRGLDQRLAAELGASGWGPWQVLAAVFGATTCGAARAEALYSGAPYGVGYHVAVWEGADR
jgi:hypothetical protein